MNGRPLGAVEPNDLHVFIWPDAKLPADENRIEAVATRGGEKVTDAYTVTVDPNAK